jgi:hypothetical protein
MGGLIFSAALAAGGTARAENVTIEAEGVYPFSLTGPWGFSISSPLFLRDSPLASSGSYLDVTGGNNTLNSPPANGEGVAKYYFSVANAGTYRIWARVITPSNMGDSFWIRMNTLQYAADFGAPKVVAGPWIKWNTIPLGTNWHWVQVKADGATGPAQFSLKPNDDPNAPDAVHQGHQLELGYREDGARVDMFVVTNDTAFNPNATPTAAPKAPVMQRVVEGASQFWVTWEMVPGATSYTLERRNDDTFPPPDFQVLKMGITGHSFIDATPPFNALYRVRAVNSKGTSAPSPDLTDTAPGQMHVLGQQQLVRTGSDSMTVTLPMRNTGNVYAPPGVNSLNSPPAHGRARLDFRIGQQVKTKIWANFLDFDQEAPINTAQDSFWVRMDSGSWIKWNGMKDFCEDVHNSDQGGKVVFFDLAPGSHRLEFAYREGGAILSNRIVITENLSLQEGCSD